MRSHLANFAQRSAALAAGERSGRRASPDRIRGHGGGRPGRRARPASTGHAQRATKARSGWQGASRRSRPGEPGRGEVGAQLVDGRQPGVAGRRAQHDVEVGGRRVARPGHRGGDHHRAAGRQRPQAPAAGAADRRRRSSRCSASPAPGPTARHLGRQARTSADVDGEAPVERQSARLRRARATTPASTRCRPRWSPLAAWATCRRLTPDPHPTSSTRAGRHARTTSATQRAEDRLRHPRRARHQLAVVARGSRPAPRPPGGRRGRGTRRCRTATASSGRAASPSTAGSTIARARRPPAATRPPPAAARPPTRPPPAATRAGPGRPRPARRQLVDRAGRSASAASTPVAAAVPRNSTRSQLTKSRTSSPWARLCRRWRPGQRQFDRVAHRPIMPPAPDLAGGGAARLRR